MWSLPKWLRCPTCLWLLCSLSLTFPRVPRSSQFFGKKGAVRSVDHGPRLASPLLGLPSFLLPSAPVRLFRCSREGGVGSHLATPEFPSSLSLLFYEVGRAILMMVLSHSILWCADGGVRGAGTDCSTLTRGMPLCPWADKANRKTRWKRKRWTDAIARA